MRKLIAVAAVAACGLVSIAAGPVFGATATATISSMTANVSPALHLQPKESLTWTLTGTATGTALIERSVDMQTWQGTGVQRVSAGAISQTGIIHNGPQSTYYRVRVSTITDGSFVATLADNDDFVAEWLNHKGQPIIRLYDESVRIVGDLYKGGETYIGGATPFTVTKSADQSSTSTSTGAVTGLSFPVEANKTYRFEFVLFSSAAATTTGIKLAVTGPDGSTSIVGYQIATSATAVGHSVQTNGGAYTAATSAGTTLVPNYVNGYMSVGSTPGTLALNFGSEVNASAVTIKAGSYGIIY